MPHYLIRMSASPSAAQQIAEQPRSCIKDVRRATNELGGHLDGCWFIENGDGVIALVHIPRHLEAAVLRQAFTGIRDGLEVEAETLLTLHEVNSRPREVDALVRTELWSDPVDLGSDLSFPASDPPGWMSRDPLPTEKPS